MRLGINLALVALIALFIWILISGIREPILFNAERKVREEAVITKLKDIRSAQAIYEEVTGRYAPRFDTLIQVLKTGSIKNIVVFGDPDDPTNTDVITYDTAYTAAMEKVNALGLKLDSLQYVPYAPAGTTFEIYADTLTHQATLVNVVEVGVQRAKYMGQFASAKYKKYDDTYAPEATIKFGNRFAPNVTGNWE